MPTKAPVKPLDQRALEAETRASQWLADGNQAREAGRTVKAERCFQKAQFWLDRANLLSDQAERPGPAQ
jgi:cytochrome c peroxidase